MDLEFHQLELRYERLRVHQPARERRLLASLADAGQQMPIVVVTAGSTYVVDVGAWDEVRQHSMQALQWIGSIRIGGRDVTLDENQKKLVALIQRLERESGRTVKDALGPQMGNLWEAIQSAQEGE